MFDHLRGGGEHPSTPVPSKWRTRHHPLCPSGSEFIARVIRRWLEASGVNPLHRARIYLGARLLKETFISHFSDEMLKREIFPINWKRRCWWRITAITTTTTGHTAH